MIEGDTIEVSWQPPDDFDDNTFEIDEHNDDGYSTKEDE